MVVRLNMHDNLILQKPLYLPAVYGVSCEPVNLPTDNPLCFTLLYSRHHLIEHRTAGLLCRLLLYEYLNDVELFALSERLKLGELRLNGEGLFILDIGTFACVEKVLHSAIIQRDGIYFSRRKR